MSLFRREVSQTRSVFFGPATLHQPLSIFALTVLYVLIAFGSSIYLFTAKLPRIEKVQGWIVPKAGMAQVFATKGGHASSVDVELGQDVAAGTPLATFDLESRSSNGSQIPRERAQINTRIAELHLQLQASERRSQLELERLKERVSADNNDLQLLRIKHEISIKQLGLAQDELARSERLKAAGFISGADLDKRAQAALSQELVVKETEQQIALRAANAFDSESARKSGPESAAVEASQIRAAITSLEQALVELDMQTSNVLYAPISGRVAYLNLRVGDSVAPNIPVVIIAPKGSKLEAQLLIPTRSAGFIKKGQHVHLIIDAYSFQKYGAIEGIIDDISTSSILAGQFVSPIDTKESVYRATVVLPGLEDGSRMADGLNIRSGMIASADITVESRTFVKWMMDPILSAAKRLHQG